MNQVRTICICGAGTMGSGIAQVAAQSGFNAIQYDLDEKMLERSRTTIVKNLDFLVSKGKMNEQDKEAVLARIVFTTDISQCVADVIIEAIIEKPEAKTALFHQLSAVNGPATVYATNTSSISIATIAGATANPSRVAGMHFFNPAPLMKLVEVVKGPATDPAVIDMLVELSRKMGKVPVICNDAPGFIVNRVARHYYLEGMKLVEEGHATIETVDAVMESAGFRMGPFKLMDLIGLDINYGVSNIVWEALGKPTRLTPSALQRDKVQAGTLGRKSGQGFYQY